MYLDKSSGIINCLQIIWKKQKLFCCQGMKIKILTHTAYHGYSKNKKNAVQNSIFFKKSGIFPPWFYSWKNSIRVDM